MHNIVEETKYLANEYQSITHEEKTSWVKDVELTLKKLHPIFAIQGLGPLVESLLEETPNFHALNLEDTWAEFAFDYLNHAIFIMESNPAAPQIIENIDLENQPDHSHFANIKIDFENNNTVDLFRGE